MKKLIHLFILVTGITNAQIVNIPDVNFKAKLISLGFDSNADGNINANEVPFISFLDVSNSNISDLTGIQNFSNLHSLRCSDNLLTNLDLSGLTVLSTVVCENNNLSIISITNCFALSALDLDNNQLISLDASTVHSDMTISLHNNPLISLFLKNGYSESISTSLVPSLRYICADIQEISNYELLFPLNLFPNVVINSYCSFTPGGNHNTITGSMLFDSNNNGCDANDLPQPNIRININNGTNTGATFTNSSGNYTYYTQTGSFNLTPDTENPSWFTFSPTTAMIPFANNNNNTTTQNFCIAANGVHNDIEVVIESIIRARPGFDTTYKIVYKNKGNQTLSGDVSFTYDDSVLDFISATIPTSSQNTGVLNWSYTNLRPFENRSFYITLHVNATTANPPINIGDVLTFNAIITPIISDDNPSDNTFAYRQIVVGSFDPNEITCLEGSIVPPSQIGNYLHYGVNFENTGTASAQNIVVKVVIDTTKYDVNSLQLLNTSNPAYVKITGNVAEFIFQNINLAASSGTPPVGGHGDVLFKIKTLNALTTGDLVTKTANIFFDYNAPINTGMANTIFQLLNNGQFVMDSSIVVSPNPTSSFVTINCNSNIKSIELYDVQGRILETSIENSNSSKLDISEKQNGIYFLKINTENGSKVEKIVKE